MVANCGGSRIEPGGDFQLRERGLQASGFGIDNGQAGMGIDKIRHEADDRFIVEDSVRQPAGNFGQSDREVVMSLGIIGF